MSDRSGASQVRTDASSEGSALRHWRADDPDGESGS